MDETNAPAAADDSTQLDPVNGDPRALMQALLPVARRNYVKAWELLADATTPLERRRVARDRAKAVAQDHAVIAAALRAREASLSGDDLLNARHLASELERHAEALDRMAEVSPVGLQGSQSLRPEALGCGRRYRDPAKAPAGEQSGAKQPGKRGGGSPRGGDRGSDQRRSARPYEDRGPKVPRDQLGTSKHDSALGDDLDADTRAKLEALRAQLGE
jgi:hypothetical protein